MYTKFSITGTITSVTGMHIGGGNAFSAIGAIDSAVVRDVQSDLPMIPGSSLKGKMRYLLARQYGDGKLLKSHDDDDIRVGRLFGYSEGNGKITHAARLSFSDLFMTNHEELKRIGVQPTEVKFENTINRLTSVANPRQIERSVPGAEYGLNLMYTAEKEEEILEDMKTIRDGLILLTYDYLGGSGSRGYGRVKISDLELTCVVGAPDEDLLQTCKDILKEVTA